jgi:hypothetical protein
MTRLRALVYRDRATAHEWITEATLDGLETVWQTRRLSHPEAMQAAAVMLRDLDHYLMDQVHAERMERRA